MPNVGEEIAGEYLRWVRDCEFVNYNVRTGKGETDVIGVSLSNDTVYFCECAMHLSGLNYGGKKTVAALIQKFLRASNYVAKYLNEYGKTTAMLWTPVMRARQRRAIEQVFERELAPIAGWNFELIEGPKFQSCLDELRAVASEQTSNLTSPVMRLMQIEGRLQRHNDGLNW